MIEIITVVYNNAEGIHRHISTPISSKDLIILTHLTNEDNIEFVLLEEYLHYILHREYGFKVSRQLHSVIKYIECSDKEFNYLKFLSILSKISREDITYNTDERDYDNVFWELEEDEL